MLEWDLFLDSSGIISLTDCESHFFSVHPLCDELPLDERPDLRLFAGEPGDPLVGLVEPVVSLHALWGDFGVVVVEA